MIYESPLLFISSNHRIKYSRFTFIKKLKIIKYDKRKMCDCAMHHRDFLLLYTRDEAGQRRPYDDHTCKILLADAEHFLQ